MNAATVYLNMILNPCSLNKSKFVVFSQHRSGSSFLVDLLSSVPSIKCYGELFKPDTNYTDKKWLNANRNRYANWKEEVQQNPLKYLDDIFDLNVQYQSVGFKLLFGHHPVVIDYVTHSSNFRKIILLRNPISRYISHARAASTREWCKLSDRDLPTPVLTFHRHVLRIILEGHAKFVSITDKMKAQSTNLITTVDYDEVVNLSRIEQIVNDLGIDCPPREELTSNYRKQTTEPLESLFINYKEMKTYVETHCKEWLEHPGAPLFI